jgi:hypothetical protein
MGSKEKGQGGFATQDDASTEVAADQEQIKFERKTLDVPREITQAFMSMIRHFGSEVEPFINIDEFWSRDEYIDYWRIQLEKHISEAYLPGFEFESRKHFMWHFQERDDPFILLRGRSLETHFETWLRSIMVPRSVHYRSEVAAAMHRWEEKYRPRLEMRGLWKESMSWKNRTMNVFTLATSDGGYETSLGVRTRSIQRWRSEAQTWRDERRSGSVPSGWCIDCIEFEGDEQLRHDFEEFHFDVPEHLQGSAHYRETWIWHPIKGRPVPHCDEITFGKPATSDLWKKQWKAKRAKS